MKEISLKELTDEQLVDLAGDTPSAMAVLISRYITVVNRVAFQFEGVLDFDDLVQEGSMGLLDAIGSFDSEKEASFKTFASLCIRNKILKAIEKVTSLKSGKGQKAVSLDDVKEEVSPDTPESIFIGKESLFAVMDDVKKVLSKREREVLFAHLGGLDYKTIAKNSGITEKAVDNALQRVRRKLKSIKRA